MERFDENEILYLEEDDNRTVYKYITPKEFQFIYDCIQGKFQQIVPNNSKNKLENKIVAYLEPNINLTEIDFKKFANCDEAKKQLEKPKKRDKNAKIIQLNAKFYCSSLPKFMNIYISQIFTNLLSIENRDELFNSFVSLHIDIFTNFFINRERKISKNQPYLHLYRNLINMYDDPFYGEKNAESLMELEAGKEKNLIYNTYVEYQRNFNEKELNKSKSYFYDCTKKTATIDKLLCGLTHKRHTYEAFKFEKRFEHSTQFKSYKGGVKFKLKGLEQLSKTVEVVDKEGNLITKELDQTIKELYIKSFNIVFNDVNVKTLFYNCINNPDISNSTNCNTNKEILEKITTLFSSQLQIEFINDLNKNIKGDIVTTKPIYQCGTNYDNSIIIGLDKKIELKYFDYDDIMFKKQRTVHLIRILEPNVKEIKDNITTTLYDENSKEFNDFFELILNTLIDTLLKNLDSFLKLIINKTNRTEGIIIDGPKYIRNTKNWHYFLNKGDTLQRGIGPSINLLLPENPDVWEFDYNYKSNLFCLKKN
jgi:hypothetical protein